MRLARSTSYNFLGMAVPLLVSLFTIPLLVGEIGAARFGALAIVWVLLGYFGAADFGIGRAIAQRVASQPDEDPALRARAVWSALILIAGLGLITGVIALLVASIYFGEAFIGANAVQEEMAEAAWLLGPCVFVAAFSGVPAGALMGVERWKSVAIGNAVGQAGIQIAPLIVAMVFSTAMSDLVIAVIIGRSLGTIIHLINAWRAMLRHHPVSISRREMAGLTRFGVWVMVGTLIGPLMVVSDRFLIGALAGAVAVAAYTIPFQVAYRTLVLPNALSHTIFPRLASIDGEDARKLGSEVAQFIGLAFAPLVIGLIVLAEPLLELWLGSKLDPRSVPVAQIVLAGVWVNSLAQVPSALIQARGDSRFTGLLSVFELPMYLALLVSLGLTYGLPGFAAAFTIRCALDSTILLTRAGVDWSSTFRRLLSPAALIAAAMASVALELSTVIRIGAALILAGAAGTAALYLMPPWIRQRLHGLWFETLRA